MIDTSPDPIVLTNNTGSITRANKAFHSMLGYTEESLVGKPIYDYYGQEGTFEGTTGEEITMDQDALFEQFKNFNY